MLACQGWYKAGCCLPGSLPIAARRIQLCSTFQLWALRARERFCEVAVGNIDDVIRNVSRAPRGWRRNQLNSSHLGPNVTL
jgi:hypothetical protein